MSTVRLTLPWPPSVNRYWRHVGPRVLVSAEGRAYQRRVRERVQLARERREVGAQLLGRLWVRVVAYPPDKRRRDLDNLGKATLDALGAAGLYADDSQVDRWWVERGDVGLGELEVEVREL